MESKTQTLDRVVIRFAGDSGDGMQLTGTEFTKAAAEAGNDISTFPDFPAEIRAPAGSLFGVSGFQLHFSSSEIHTPGDAPDVLVAMNPAALKTNLKDLLPGGVLVLDSLGGTEALIFDCDGTLADTMPAQLTGVTWTCASAGGASCTAAGSFRPSRASHSAYSGASVGSGWPSPLPSG